MGVDGTGRSVTLCPIFSAGMGGCVWGLTSHFRISLLMVSSISSSAFTLILLIIFSPKQDNPKYLVDKKMGNIIAKLALLLTNKQIGECFQPEYRLPIAEELPSPLLLILVMEKSSLSQSQAFSHP